MINDIKKDIKPFKDIGMKKGNNGPHPVHGGDSTSLKKVDGVWVWKYHGSKEYKSDRGSIIDAYMVKYEVDEKKAIKMLTEEYGDAEVVDIQEKREEKKTVKPKPVSVSPNQFEFYEDSQGKNRSTIYRGPDKPSLKIKDADYFDIQAALYGSTLVQYAVLRWDEEDGKEVRQLTKIDDDVWKLGYKQPSNYLRPMYKFGEFNNCDEIWVVEGEKCMNRLQREVDRLHQDSDTFPDVCVTSLIGGSNAHDTSDLSYLNGKTVRVIPDNDKAGKKLAMNISMKMRGSTLVAKLDNLDEREDIYDWIEKGGDLRRIKNGDFDTSVSETKKAQSNIPTINGELDLAEYVKEKFFIKTEKLGYSGRKVFSEGDGRCNEEVELDMRKHMRRSDVFWIHALPHYYDEDQGIWVKLTKGKLQHLLKSINGMEYFSGGEVKFLSISKSKIDNIYDLIKGDSMYNSELNKDGFMDKFDGSFASKNETIFYSEGELIRVQSSRTPMCMMFRSRINGDTNAGASSEKFENFLKSCFVDNLYINKKLELLEEGPVSTKEMSEAKDKIRLLQQYIGASLFKKVDRVTKALMLYGPGGGGKSVFMSVINHIFSNYTASVSPQNMSDKHGCTQLIDSDINICSDIDSDDLFSTGKLKQIISGDRVSVEKKYKDQFGMRFTMGHIFSANELPYAKDMSDGFWDRWAVVGFHKNLRGTDKAVSRLPEIMKDDKIIAGVIEWAIDGFIDLAENDYQLIETDECEELKNQWRIDSDSVLEFVSDMILMDYDNTADLPSAYTCYDNYQKFCKDAGRKDMNRRRFLRRMKAIADDELSVLKRIHRDGRVRYNLKDTGIAK